MKVITIKQPWASLIAEGYKKYEFRTWNTKYRGDILIHAGKSIDKKAMKLFEDYNLEYPRGCIIAKANLIDSIVIDEEFIKISDQTIPPVYKSMAEEKRNVYGFKLENVKKIKPIYTNGKLSLWNYEWGEKNDI